MHSMSRMTSLMNLTTLGFNAAAMNVSLKDASGKATTCKLQLLFNGNECKISALTEGFTADGSGSFVEKGEKQSMGGTPQCALSQVYCQFCCLGQVGHHDRHARGA